MAEYLTNDTDLKKVANAIRAKGGTSANLSYPDEFVSAIQAIQTGSEKEEQEKSVTITANGTTEITPDTGKTLSKATVTVDVPTSGNLLLATVDIVDGIIEFTLPSVYMSSGVCNFMLIRSVSNSYALSVIFRKERNSTVFYSIQGTSDGYIIGNNYVSYEYVENNTKVKFTCNIGDSGSVLYSGSVKIYGNI